MARIMFCIQSRLWIPASREKELWHSSSLRYPDLEHFHLVEMWFLMQTQASILLMVVTLRLLQDTLHRHLKIEPLP
ncbi:hypothetical protein DAA48_22395 [Aeromonas veronii]|uniref:Uncharacterized protein n=1 Tax=Aeromonas veronii TaxID=654 RepID=A0A2T4MXC0_AERVE|nr:hypothetical protein DAA48_22395 [Aeromonas veronii]